MSSSSHTNISERRLRPIYDYLDNGNNKKALQEADKVLRKQKDFVCAKALKSISLLRLGRSEESFQLLSEIHSTSPVNGPTLQAMCICYKEMDRVDLIADLYSKAYKVERDNEDILTSLFMSYVRLGEYKKQQQTALILHKLKPDKNPYYFWAIMSLIMQAYDADESLAQQMYLPLAYKMAKKYADEKRIEAEAETRLYLLIHELQEKYEEALKILESDLADKLKSELDFVECKKAEYAAQLENWSYANTIYRSLLVSNPDQWTYYELYLDSAFKLFSLKHDSENEVGQSDHTPEDVLKFLNLQINNNDSLNLRGPHLSLLLFSHRLSKSNISGIDQLDSIDKLIEKYYLRFGDKPCCYLDLRPYLSHMKSPCQVIDSLLEEFGLTNEQGERLFPDDVKAMHRHLTLLQISLFVNHTQYASISEDDKLVLVHDCIARYRHGLKFGENCLSTDIQPADTYIVIAVNILLSLYDTSGKQSYLWSIIILLEKSLIHSPSNYNFKFVLIRLYCNLGIFDPCPDIYESMEIKQIQNASLGYTVSHDVLKFGCFSSASCLFSSMLKFFSSTNRDTTDYLISAYKYGSFTKIKEFISFRVDLNNCYQYVTARIERALLELTIETNSFEDSRNLVSYMDVQPDVDKVKWDELVDKRDFSILSSLESPNHLLTEDLKKLSFDEEKAWLKIRDLTFRILASLLLLTSDKPSNHATNGDSHSAAAASVTLVRSLTNQLQEHLESTCQQFSQSFNYPRAGPATTRIRTYLSLNCGDVLIKAVEFSLFYFQQFSAENEVHKDVDLEEFDHQSILTSFQKIISRCSSSVVSLKENGKFINPEVIECMVLSTELFAHVVTIISPAYHMLKKAYPHLHKKNKKRKELSEKESGLVQKFTEWTDGLHGNVTVLRQHIQKMDVDMLNFSLESLNVSKSLDIENSEEQRVWKKVEKSLHYTCEELTDIIKRKTVYLLSFKS